MLTCFYSKGALLCFFGFPFPVVCCFCVFEWSAKATFPKFSERNLSAHNRAYQVVSCFKMASEWVDLLSSEWVAELHCQPSVSELEPP